MGPKATCSSQDLSRDAKPKLIRRHGACEPCRASKTKCDGGQPCCSCRSEKRKAKTCEYNQKAREIAAARSRHESEHNSTTLQSNAFEPDTAILSYHETMPDTRSNQAAEVAAPKGDDLPLMFRRIALCRVVDEFIRVKPLKGHALNIASNALRAGVDICRDKHRSGISHLTWKSKDDFERVRVEAGENDDHEHLPMYIVSLRRQLEHIHSLTNSGHLREAWVACGTVIREIQAFEVETLYLAKLPLPAADDLSVCTELLHLDCCLSFFLGCRSSLQSTPLLKEILLQQHQESPTQWPTARLELYQTMRSIGTIDITNEAGITQFVRLAKCIVKDSSPSHPLYQIAHCPQGEDDAMVLASICSNYSLEGNVVPPTQDNIFQIMELHTPRSRSSYCKSAIKHAQFVLEAFHRLRELEPEATSKSWLRIYGALVALELAAAFKLREKHVDPGVELKMNVFHADIKALQALTPENPIFSPILEVRRRFTQNLANSKSLEHPQDKLYDKKTVQHTASASTENSDSNVKQQKRTHQANTRSRKRSFDQMSHIEASPSETDDMAMTADGVSHATFSTGTAYPTSEASSQLSLSYPHPPLYPSMDAMTSMKDLNTAGTTSFSEADHPIFQAPQYDFIHAPNEDFHPPLALPEYNGIHPPMLYGSDIWAAEVWPEHNQLLYPVSQHDTAMPVHSNDHLQVTLSEHPDSPHGSHASQLAAIHYGNVNQTTQSITTDKDDGNFFQNFNTRSFEGASMSQEPSLEPSAKRDRTQSLQESDLHPLWGSAEESILPISAVPNAAPMYPFHPDLHSGNHTSKPHQTYNMVAQAGHLPNEVTFARADLNGLGTQPNYNYHFNTGMENMLNRARYTRVASYS